MLPFVIEVTFTPKGEPIVDAVPLVKGRQRITEGDVKEIGKEVERALRAFANRSDRSQISHPRGDE